MNNLENLVTHLKSSGVLKSESIVEAFLYVDRKDFVREDQRAYSYDDRPLSIGEGQTISQPTTVAFMLELLELKPGERVLDVGSGSGWTTTLLAHIVGNRGQVYGVERIPELVSFGKTNLQKYKFAHADILSAGKSLGFAEKGPFDKILVSAESKDIPEELILQLKQGGTMVIPVKHAVWKIKKLEDETLDIKKFEGFVFVPLLQN